MVRKKEPKLSTVIRRRAKDHHEAEALFLVMMNALERGDTAKAHYCRAALSARAVFVHFGPDWLYGEGNA